MFCCSLSVLNMLICVPVSGSRPFRGNLLLHPSCCCYGTLPCPSPLLGATTNHDIARMIPHLHTQGIVPLCQVVSLHKALHPCAIVRRGRLHRTMCHCGHGLHTTTCHVANDANKACPMCLAHVWGLTLKPLSVATPMPPYLPQVTKVPLPPFFLKSILGHFGGDIIHTWEGIMNFN